LTQAVLSRIFNAVQHPEPIDYQPFPYRLKPQPISHRNRSRWPLRLALAALALLAALSIVLWVSAP